MFSSERAGIYIDRSSRCRIVFDAAENRKETSMRTLTMILMASATSLMALQVANAADAVDQIPEAPAATETYAAPHTGSTMFRLEMIVNIPVAVKMSEFRNSLGDFCDQKNLDIQIEPYTV